MDVRSEPVEARNGKRNEPEEPESSPGRGLVKDLSVPAAGVLLFVLAAVIGHHLDVRYDQMHLRLPPLYAYWDPKLGPGTLPALVLAGLTVAYGPPLARRLPWRGLVWAVWGGSMAWCWSLALVDGWHRGVARRLTTRYEYLQEVDRVRELGPFLRTFTDHILLDAPDNWVPHVAGHPPGALLSYVALDRIGLAGGGWAGAFTITVASSAAAAVVVAVRALGGPDGEATARRVAPFAVLAPTAVWTAVSADGYFTAVSAWALALLALAASGRARRPWATALGSGLLFGWLVYLSYGLVLTALMAGAVLLAARNARPVPWVLLGMAPWVAAFTAGGFWWLDGYFTLHERYYQGAAAVRPFAYFVWGNLAANVVVLGFAALAGLRRAALALPGAVREVRRGPVTGTAAPVLLVAGGAAMLLAADLSGMSKAETERIWLPFTLWLVPAAALLPARSHRGWLAVQAATALAVNHLLFTGW